MALYFEVMVGTSSCLTITDGDGSGLRICGGKQWGGARTAHKWEITESVAQDIINCLQNDFPSLFDNAQQPLQPDNGYVCNRPGQCAKGQGGKCYSGFDCPDKAIAG